MLSGCGAPPPQVAATSPSAAPSASAAPSLPTLLPESIASPGISTPPPAGRWLSLPNMSAARLDFTATALRDGRILIVGGRTKAWAYSADGSPTPLVDIFDGASKGFRRAASLAIPRAGQTATLLASGKVLVAGGDPSGSAEIYDPAADSWTPASRMHHVRYDHAATLIAGGKVLVTGGASSPPLGISARGAQPAQLPAEIYDPARDAWDEAAAPRFDRPVYPTATPLQDGRVFVVGGQYMENSPDQGTETSELYDPRSNTWAQAAPETRTVARQYHSATLLADGRVLVAGGVLDGRTVSSAVVYDPKTNTWTVEANMNEGRCGQGSALLANGLAFVFGSGCWNAASAGAEEFDPSTTRWYAVASLAAPRGDIIAAVLPNGDVLAAGGGMPTNMPTSVAELFVPI